MNSASREQSNPRILELPPEPGLLRPFLALAAVLGVLETSILAWLSHHGQEAACPAAAGPGCGLTLESGRAYFLGLPLPLLGYASYALVAFLALAPFLVRESGRRLLWQHRTRFGLLLVPAAMAVFSLDLMKAMTLELGAFCPWCVVSASLSWVLCLTSLAGFRRSARPLLAPVLVGMALGGLAIGLARSLSPSYLPIDAKREIGTPSTPEQIELARHLVQSGAKFYGTLWCRHCWEQKELFGKEAASLLPFVDCTLTPPPPGVSEFPTWELGRRRLSGVQSLQALAILSSFRPEGSAPESAAVPSPDTSVEQE